MCSLLLTQFLSHNFAVGNHQASAILSTSVSSFVSLTLSLFFFSFFFFAFFRFPLCGSFDMGDDSFYYPFTFLNQH